MWIQRVGQFSLAIPAILMLVAGFALAIRSVDVRVTSTQGVRQVASNLTCTLAVVALLVAVLVSVQRLVGFNLAMH